MSGKFLARVSAMSLAMLLAACGGDESSTPLAGTGSNSNTETGATTGDTTDSEQQEVVLELGIESGSSFISGQMLTSADTLSAGASTRIEFNVVNAADGNAIYNASETSASISSLCQTAVFDSPITTSSGTFSATYEANCAGSDTITARLANGATASANITVAPPEVGELEFVSAEPDSIALSGNSNSSRPSVSEVTFRLADKNGNPITTGETIEFELSTTNGGISLSQDSTETDEQGLAATRVNAGTVASVVSVTATYTPESGTSIQTTSAPISISSAIPDQDSFSISIEENFLPNARNYDGIRVPITIRAADRNNNRVSGAVVNFVTNGGSVQSECTLQDGACAIEWVSQSPKPDDGVVLILARTVGEESFTDVNSDGKFDPEIDTFSTENDDIGEAYLDVNRSGNYNSGEVYFDYNDNGTYDAPNGIYNGTACISESGCSTELLEITQTGKIFLASDDISISFTTPVAPGRVCAEIAGVFTNNAGETVKGPPPGGTNIAFTTTNGSVVAPNSFSSPTDYSETPLERCVTVEADDESSTGTFTIEVTPPAPFNSDPFVAQEAITD